MLSVVDCSSFKSTFLRISDASRKGLRRVKLYYDPDRDRYVVFHVEYADGSDVNLL